MNRRWLLHLLFWLSFWFIYAYIYSKYDGNLPKYLYTEAVQMPARALATYLAFWFFDRYSSGNSWKAFAGAAASAFAGGLINRAIKMVYLVPVYFPEASFEFWGYRMMYDVFDCMLAASTALSARMFFKQQALLRREHQLRAEKSEAELRALRAQIHPHFLFNTINNLYALARVKSDKTAPVALKLAQLMRYVLYESQKPMVTLEQEMQLIRDYTELERLRFDEGRLDLVLNFEASEPERSIAPLLLLPLVENAFKHGAGEQEEGAFVHLELKQHKEKLYFKVFNSRVIQADAEQSGIGLSNLKQQLELLYSNRYTLDVTSTEHHFQVILEIDNTLPGLDHEKP